MEPMEHVQSDMRHRGAIQTAEMRQSPVSLHIMMISFCMQHSDNPCCKRTGKKWAAELCKGHEGFLDHKQQGPDQNPGVTRSKVVSVEVA